MKEEHNTSIGIGDGTGQMFVHGTYEAIKLLQSKLLRLEELERKEKERNWGKTPFLVGRIGRRSRWKQTKNI